MMDEMGWREAPGAIAALSALSRLAARPPAIAALCAAVLLSAAASAFLPEGKARSALRAWTCLAVLAQAALAGTVAWVLLRFTAALMRA